MIRIECGYVYDLGLHRDSGRLDPGFYKGIGHVCTFVCIIKEFVGKSAKLWNYGEEHLIE